MFECFYYGGVTGLEPALSGACCTMIRQLINIKPLPITQAGVGIHVRTISSIFPPRLRDRSLCIFSPSSDRLPCCHLSSGCGTIRPDLGCPPVDLGVSRRVPVAAAVATARRPTVRSAPGRTGGPRGGGAADSGWQRGRPVAATGSRGYRTESTRGVCWPLEDAGADRTAAGNGWQPRQRHHRQW